MKNLYLNSKFGTLQVKKLFIGSLIFFTFLAFGYQPAFGQGSGTSTEDATASLNISKNIIKIIGSLAKDFTDMKGDLITKTDDGTSVYGVKNLDGMMESSQYIMIKSDGGKYYIASYKDDYKKLGMSFAAFTGGVTTVTNNDGNFSVEPNKEKSTSDKLVYMLLVKGTKVGSFTMEMKAQEGTMIIGFL
jgi:hypothetical protein